MQRPLTPTGKPFFMSLPSVLSSSRLICAAASNSALRATVSVITGAAANIQCSVGVNNVGSTLYEGGRITRQ